MPKRDREVQFVEVHLGLGVRPKGRRGRNKRGNAIKRFLDALLARLGFGRPGAPAEAKEIPREAPREKSKIETMLRIKPGWYGDRLRHRKAALKAWQTRRKKELALLERKEREGGLSGRESRKKKGLELEMERISKGIDEVEEQLREMKKPGVREKTVGVSAAVMRGTGEVAEKAIEAVEEMPKHAGTGHSLQIILGETRHWESQDIDTQIKQYKRLIKRLEFDYLKRRIGEEQYRKRLAEYQQKLSELEERKRLKRERDLKEKDGKAVGPLGPKAVEVLEKGVSSEVSHEKIAEIERHVAELLKKYRIPASEAGEHGLDKNRIIQDFDKLINLIELEREAKRIKEEPIEKPLLPLTSKRKERIKAIAKEIKKYRIVTDFDRVLNEVRQRGKVNASELRKALKMDKGRFNECVEVLEKSGLIKIEYPAIGRIKLVDVNFKEKKKKK